MTTQVSPRRLTIALASMLLLGACDKGGATAGPGEGPPKPEYATSFEAIEDLPNQLSEQVKWAAQPIEDAATLGNEIAALKANLNVDAATFESMCKVAFTDGKIELGAQTELGDRRAEVEATLAKIKQVGVDLKNIPGRVKVAGKNMGKLVTSSPSLALKATKELKGQISTASGDTKIQLEADLKAVAGLPKEVKAEALELKQELTSLPAKAKDSVTNLMAAFAGKPMPNAGTAAPAAATEPGADPTAPAAPAGPTGQPPAPAPAPTGQPIAAAPAPAPTEPTPAPAPAPVAASHPVPPPPPGAAASPPSPGKAARIAALERQAKERASRGDYLSAANDFEEAYYLDPGRPLLAFRLGEAAWKAKDCQRAMSYLDQFSSLADKAQHGSQLTQTSAILRELKTFDCPPRTPDDEGAYAETLAARAEKLGSEGDWGGAAALYAEGYQRTPDDHAFAYHVAVASWNARECGDAGTYLKHFSNVGDARKHRRELKDTSNRISQLSAGECPTWGPGERDGHARTLFSQALELEKKLDYRQAASKYERAYALLPENHAFAWRIAEASWNGYDCQTSETYLRKFVAAGTDPKLAADLQKAKGLLARVDTVGCPDALWSTSPGSAAPATEAGSAPAEGPPPSAATGGAKTCSVSDGGSGEAWWLLMVVAAAWRRRRS